MKTRYKLHWASGRGPAPNVDWGISKRDAALELKWEIWDWELRVPIAFLENRAVGRKICALLNAVAKEE